MSSGVIITQTQSECLEEMHGLVVDAENNPVGSSKTNVAKRKEKQDRACSFRDGSYVPNKKPVITKEGNGNNKTSIECVQGQMKMFKETMKEVRQKRARVSDENHERAVTKWDALLPQPNWDALLGKKKRRLTRTNVYVEDKKKMIVQEELSELAASCYEYDK